MLQHEDTMRPKRTDSTVKVPIAFSKRSEGSIDTKTMVIVSIVATVLFLAVMIGVLTGSSSWFIKIPVVLIAIYLYIFFFRFFVFGEGRVSDAYENMIENDYQLSTNVFWNIYDKNKNSPYVVHYANGLKGIFVQFNKDVIVGKEDHQEFSHFEALGDMLNVAHTLGLDVIDIDYMDSVGNDERMGVVHANASNVSNPDLKAILTSIYTNLEHEMELDYTSYDVYLFVTRGREEDLWYNVRQVIEFGLKANYASYTLLNPERLRKMTQSIMNLENFSMIRAEKEVVNSTLQKRIRLIKLIKSDGTVEILGKTLEEIKREREIEKGKRQSKVNSSKGYKNKSKTRNVEDDSLIDLFEDDSKFSSIWGSDYNTEQNNSNGQNQSSDWDSEEVKTSKNNKQYNDTFDDDVF